MKKLVLLDAYALIFRAYYAFIRSPRINSQGQNTSAIFGFVNTLDDILRTEQPDYVAVAFDPPGGTFRHEAYPAYKAQREATPEDIKWAVPRIKEIIEAYRIPIIEVAGYEADDVIGTLAMRAAEAGLQVEMITPDKDYAQLVRPNVTMCRPGNGAKAMERLGVEEVCEKYGLANPRQVIDLLGLMGDAADNIPGCPGVGEKTAAKLLQEFSDIETLLDNTANLKGAVRKKLEENMEKIRFSKFLATIKTDVPLETTVCCPDADGLPNFEALRRTEPDTARLTALFTQLEFRTFVARLQGEALPSPAPTASRSRKKAADDDMGDLFAGLDNSTENDCEKTAENPTDVQESQKDGGFSTLQNSDFSYHLIENIELAQNLCKELMTFATVAFDTETTSLDALNAELVGMSFAVEGRRAWYVAVPSARAEAQAIVDAFKPFFENPDILKVGQNMKYDLLVLSNYGVEVVGPLFDTMLAHYVVQPEMPHNLDVLAETYLRYRTIHIEELIGKAGKKQKNMRELAPADIRDYACEDADVALRLMEPLKREMEETGVTAVFRDIEMPLLPVLLRMECNGVCLDREALERTGNDFRKRMEALEREIYEMAGEEFLLTSPRQVGNILFEKLAISSKAKKTKSGQYSTSEEVLESLRTKHPIVELILRHRGLKKLLSTYIDALPRLVNVRTGHIHTSFNQAVTATGRLSSSNPNLQNIPVRGDDGREIRRAFIPEAGCTFLSADYSQIELRIMAHLSQDEKMIADFNAGADIHAATAARIFKKPIEDITRDERRKAKTANFGIIYGISAFGLAERMEVSRTEAKELIDTYFQTYPKVKEYMNKSVALARERGYILTEFGRRRYLPDISSRNATVRGYAERNAVNAPIQGTAADIIKLAMVSIDRRMREEHLRSKMILQVHDELNFSVFPDELERMRSIVTAEMERAYKMCVPLIAECGVGDNWLEAH